MDSDVRYWVSVSVGDKKHDYPKVSVQFSKDDDHHGYTARVEPWPNGDDGAECSHELWLRQGSPLGSIWVAFDGLSHGAWRTADISGSTLDERDLEWAAIWAVECMRDKHAVLGKCHSKSEK